MNSKKRRLAANILAFLLILQCAAQTRAYNNYNYNNDDNNNKNYKQANDDYNAKGEDVAVDDQGDAGGFNYSANVGFSAVSIMPISCLNYANGHVIKFDLYENNKSYQCHFKNLGTFVVSIQHYMRAYFNYQYVTQGNNFALPNDAGYLNCVELDETAYTGEKLYAKIGCSSSGTLSSTRLQLYVYTNKECTTLYNDGSEASNKSQSSYQINGNSFSTKVSFRPPFYSCQTCEPASISNTFTKASDNWYDDDMINGGGVNHIDEDEYDDDVDPNDFEDDVAYQNWLNQQNDNQNQQDDYWSKGVWQQKQNDDANGGNSGKYYDYYKDNDDHNKYQYNANNNNNGRRQVMAMQDDLDKFAADFWAEADYNHRQLMKRGTGNWNMCDRVWRYGVYCDEECRALDTFRADEWSSSDIFLLVIMCLFMASIMLLIFAKRVKAYERASIYGDEYNTSYPGLPPMAMVMLFILIITVILVLANLKFVNETLIFAVVTCIIMFVYMLKLTLFESRGPMLLPAAHRRSALNSMNRELFE